MQEETTEMIIGNKTFDTQHEAYIMGILNVTPDSFSDGGKFNTLDATMITSRRSLSQAVALWRILSISSLTAESFSMNVSVEGM